MMQSDENLIAVLTAKETQLRAVADKIAEAIGLLRGVTVRTAEQAGADVRIPTVVTKALPIPRGTRPGGNVAKAIDLIRKTGAPMHIRDLASALSASRPSLTTSLERAVHRKLLARVRPATYALPTNADAPHVNSATAEKASSVPAATPGGDHP